MLLKLVLTNFKQHEELEVNFGAGLQVIRGANEAGKSSIFEAVAYAFYGSRALPLSLDETVTWGKPVASLKVELTFVHGDFTYKITRKKNGAELVGQSSAENSTVTASGHAEVTVFIERLFRASASVGQATMLANQGSLKDSLKGSSTPLIEQLANMQLIDELVGKIQTTLPSGNTKAVEAQLQSYPNTPEPVLDIHYLLTEIEGLKVKLAASAAAWYEAKTRKQESDTLVEQARAVQQKQELVQNTRKSLEQQIEREQRVLATPLPAYDPKEVESLTQQAALAADHAAIYSEYQRFTKVAPTEFWPGTPAEFVAKYQQLNAEVIQRSKQISDLGYEIRALKDRKLLGSSCGYCGKDLADIPEVSEKNNRLDEEVAKAEAEYVELSKQNSEAMAQIADMRTWDQVVSSIQKLHFKYVKVDTSTVPPTLIWTLPVPEPVADSKDYGRLLDEAKRKEREFIRANTLRENAESNIRNAQQKLAELVMPELSHELHLALVTRQSTLETYTAAEAECSAIDKLVTSKLSEVDMRSRVYELEHKTWLDNRKRVEDLTQLLGQYHFHNQIISKLREARPIVAKKLWALVNSGVSYYLSQIRGTQSAVTRTETGFQIDGKPAEAYSGSAKDALGLAIRVTLQKTFLPNVGFLMVDEPAAACSDERESEMLGMLAGCGMDQIILVTHSDLADSFASAVIQI